MKMMIGDDDDGGDDDGGGINDDDDDDDDGDVQRMMMKHSCSYLPLSLVDLNHHSFCGITNIDSRMTNLETR